MNDSDSNSNSGNITVENLQDLLIYDDTFLDYFNVFLKLPVFPQPLEYQRLTDSFKILDEQSDSVVTCNSPMPFMASEEEHNRLLEWAQKYRLPLFLKTDLYRELKLSKFLIKPLQIFSSSRDSFIHGYSKQTNCSSFTTPTPSKYSDLSYKSNSMVKSFASNTSGVKNMEISDDEYVEMYESNFSYNILWKTDSRPYSMPIEMRREISLLDGKCQEIERQDNESPKLMKDISSLTEENTKTNAKKHKNPKNSRVDEDMFYRIQSAPWTFNTINFGTVNAELEESIIEELETIEGRQKISLQRLKEIMIGTHDGMNAFQKYLANTAGKYLCEFWLDCEQLKDLSAFRTQEENVDLRNNLLRNLKDKYKLNLTTSAKELLNEAMKHSLKTHSIFLQAQYDTLRRLRSYWLPRYLIHQESMMRQITFSDLFYLRRNNFHFDSSSLQSGVFPKLILQSTLPFLTNKNEVQATRWSELMCFSNKPVFEPPKPEIITREKSNFADGIFKRSAFQNRLRFALGFDTASGSPFKNYLQNHNLEVLVKNLDFFQEVFRFKFIYSRNSDRILKLSQAWSIVNRFIVSTGPQFIEIPESESKNLIAIMKKFKNSMKNNIFDEILEYSVKQLQVEWLIYLKEDVKKFMESSLTRFDIETPPHTIDEVEVTIEGETIVVRRKFSEKDLKKRALTWDQLTKKEKQLRRAAALQLRKITENERKRVLKTIQRRIKMEEEERRLKAISFLKIQKSAKSETLENETDEVIEEAELLADKSEIKIEEKIPEMKRVMNKVLLKLFKQYVSDHDTSDKKDVTNSLMLLQELSNYLSIDGTEKVKLVKKDNMAATIFRNHLDKDSKFVVPLSDKIRKKLSNDQKRPKSPILKEIQTYTYNQLNGAFQDFWKYELTKLGVKSDILAKMTEKELQSIADHQIIKTTKIDEIDKANDEKDFLLTLEDTSYKPLTLKILYFFHYLLEKGQENNKNNLDKDLFFYVEVLKLKEICRTTVDEEIAKKKIQCITSAFLDSVYPPSVQISISSDSAQKILRQVQKQMTNKEVNVDIFNDAQKECFNVLLPYYSRFKRQWQQPIESKVGQDSIYQQLQDRKMKYFSDGRTPSVDFVTLPSIQKGTNLNTLLYTMNDGPKWKQSMEASPEIVPNRQEGTESDSSRSMNQSFGKRLSRKASRLSIS